MLSLIGKTKKLSNLPLDIYSFRLKKFKPNVYIRIEKSNYIIKTVEDYRGLIDVLKLRYRVFNLQKRKILKIDIDEFDKIADHLIVYDTAKNIPVGTYRVLCSEFTDRFYSESEFDISQIKSFDGVKVELGRASILPEYRNGLVIMLLWKAISEYVSKVNGKFLFGCSSVFTTDPLEVAFITDYLIRNYGSQTVEVKPYKTVKGIEKSLSFLRENMVNTDFIESKIPSLLKVYLNAGAKICGLPYLDEEFGCVDFFTFLDISKLNESFKRKYGKSI
ncbi:MAG: GNAT family N-acyltransferase [Hydrogenothermaceae bacterium]